MWYAKNAITNDLVSDQFCKQAKQTQQLSRSPKSNQVEIGIQIPRVPNFAELRRQISFMKVRKLQESAGIEPSRMYQSLVFEVAPRSAAGGGILFTVWLWPIFTWNMSALKMEEEAKAELQPREASFNLIVLHSKIIPGPTMKANQSMATLSWKGRVSLVYGLPWPRFRVDINWSYTRAYFVISSGKLARCLRTLLLR